MRLEHFRGEREAGDDVLAMSFATERLTVVPDDERAFTDAAVHMTHGRSELDGQGLQLDQLHGTFSLNQVSATFYPKSRDKNR